MTAGRKTVCMGRSGGGRLAVAVACLFLAGGQRAAAQEPEFASPWVVEQASRTRLVAGGVQSPNGGRRLYAGVEIALENGWKTYWRNPGSSGVPPHIDWQGSENLAQAELSFPAPQRFKDRDGDTIGYKHAVVLPLALQAKDPTKPIMLKIAAEFGICREVCVPVQPVLTLVVPPEARERSGGTNLADAVARVPTANAGAAGAPTITRIVPDLAVPKPKLVIEARFPGDAGLADMFLEAPDGIWIPLPKAAGRSADGTARFEVDLSEGADLADLKGRTIRATLVGAAGQSETTFVFPPAS